jgi:hypothetical protein
VSGDKDFTDMIVNLNSNYYNLAILNSQKLNLLYY